MCGVAGAFAAHPTTSVPAIAGRLTTLLAHRGPDGEAFWCDQPAGAGRVPRADLPACAAVALGHRRLSIVDLATGDQPMANEDGTVWVAFNGEIYNHLDLRWELTRAGHRFHTKADTEVLVHGWEEGGPALFGGYPGYWSGPGPGTFHRNAWKPPPGHCCHLPLDAPPPPHAPRFEAF